MIEMLIQIPGPRFLIYFTGLSIICIIIGWYWLNGKESNKYTLPETTRFDPITIAALRGRWASVIRTAVFSLWSRDLVKIKIKKHTKKHPSRKDEIKIKSVSVKSSRKPSNPIEKEFHHLFREEKEPRDLFQDNLLRNKFEKRHLEPIYKELEQQHLLRAESGHYRAWMITIIMGIIITAIGGTKLYFGFIRMRPIGFLFLLLVVSLIVLFMALKPWSIHTRLGRRYLKDLKEHFEWLKPKIETGSKIEGIDPALPVAIFGTGILSGYYHNEKFMLAFPTKKESKGNWYGGGGCGGCGGGLDLGGCGGGSSGCGGGGGGCGGGGSSGCGGGGGGCGGGCGGCGGCG